MGTAISHSAFTKSTASYWIKSYRAKGSFLSNNLHSNHNYELNLKTLLQFVHTEPAKMDPELLSSFDRSLLLHSISIGTACNNISLILQLSSVVRYSFSCDEWIEMFEIDNRIAKEYFAITEAPSLAYRLQYCSSGTIKRFLRCFKPSATLFADNLLFHLYQKNEIEAVKALLPDYVNLFPCIKDSFYTAVYYKLDFELIKLLAVRGISLATDNIPLNLRVEWCSDLTFINHFIPDYHFFRDDLISLLYRHSKFEVIYKLLPYIVKYEYEPTLDAEMNNLYKTIFDNLDVKLLKAVVKDKELNYSNDTLEERLHYCSSLEFLKALKLDLYFFDDGLFEALYKEGNEVAIELLIPRAKALNVKSQFINLEPSFLYKLCVLNQCKLNLESCSLERKLILCDYLPLIACFLSNEALVADELLLKLYESGRYASIVALLPRLLSLKKKGLFTFDMVQGCLRLCSIFEDDKLLTAFQESDLLKGVCMSEDIRLEWSVSPKLLELITLDDSFFADDLLVKLYNSDKEAVLRVLKKLASVQQEFNLISLLRNLFLATALDVEMITAFQNSGIIIPFTIEHYLFATVDEQLFEKQALLEAYKKSRNDSLRPCVEFLLVSLATLQRKGAFERNISRVIAPFLELVCLNSDTALIQSVKSSKLVIARSVWNSLRENFCDKRMIELLEKF